MSTATTKLVATLSTSPQNFLQPSAELHNDTLTAIKELLDPLALDVTSVQKLRRDENRKKRKRGETDGEEPILQLRQVYTNGLAVRQVWEQAKRIIDAACTEVERDLETRNANGVRSGVPSSELLVKGDAEILTDEDSELQGDDEEKQDEEEGIFDEEDDLDLDDEAMPEDEDLELDLEQGDTSDNYSDGDEWNHTRKKGKSETYVQDPNKLNDGFFSIDDFNKQTQFLEQQDVRGEDDNPSDEDEIDWDANPLAVPLTKTQKSSVLQNRSKNDLEDESSEEHDGPTFGNADLDASDSENDGDGEALDGDDLDGAMSGLDNTNEIRYVDFFEPPAKKPSKTKRMRALPKTQPVTASKSQSKDDSDTEMRRAMDDVRRDLLDSDEELSDMESGSDTNLKTSSNKNLSTHEKQKAAIAAEIRRLEAANVAKKDWTLAGEARAAERPLNSLIEEDMEFERVGKPVPVITAEVSEELEQLVKRRILAREFDEVIRRLPDAIGNAADQRRGRVEVDDTKAQTGLAEVYEQAHLKATDPGYVDKRSAATKKQHADIDRLWKEVSSQLDLLSNLHFKPKRMDMEIKMVGDKPTISMEDARPVGGTTGEESMLAPQEVYKPGVDGAKGQSSEIIRKSGAGVNKEEMSREEKLRRRRRQKERTKKANANKPLDRSGKESTSTATDEKKSRARTKTGKLPRNDREGLLKDLEKGNVKVIGKKGELQDIGKQKQIGNGPVGGSSLKL